MGAYGLLLNGLCPRCVGSLSLLNRLERWEIPIGCKAENLNVCSLTTVKRYFGIAKLYFIDFNVIVYYKYQWHNETLSPLDKANT